MYVCYVTYGLLLLVENRCLYCGFANRNLWKLYLLENHAADHVKPNVLRLYTSSLP